MEILLQKDLEHQQKAIDVISQVFKGVYIEQPRLYFENPCIDVASPVIKSNIKQIQEAQNIPYEYRHFKPASNGCLNLDIKMETGTGKTYVYSKAMYELNKQYGLNKFIIAVPSLPIKAGTSQFLQEGYVQRHFTDGCGYDIDIEVGVLEAVKNNGKKKRKYFPGVISDFVTGTCQNTRKIYVLLVNMQLLTSAMLTSDYDGGIAGFYRPIDALRATKPVVIIDEPHRFNTKKISFKVISEQIQPQCIIRFGATFPEITEGKGKNKHTRKDYENLLYDLNACVAFNNGLIKGVAKEHFESLSGKNEKIKILSIKGKKTVNLIKRSKEGEKTYTLRKGDSLSLVSEDLAGITITAIGETEVGFSNGIVKNTKEEIDVDIYMNSYQEQMLKLAIDRHLETEKENFNRDCRIKTLALFFIDDIASYRPDSNGKSPYLREAFERLLKEAIERELNNSAGLSTEYQEYLKASLTDLSACHAGYFSQDNIDKDENVAKEVDVILHGKKQLLSFRKPDGSYNTLRFLFSKWTLKEGWDNPNVFTIAKLRSSGSENSKLQEVGRGLRLPVNEQGWRVSNEPFTLNYIVDFTEEDFARKLVCQINGEIPQAMTISKELLNSVAQKQNKQPTSLLAELLSSGYVDLDYNIIESNCEEFMAKYPEFFALREGKIVDRNKTKPKDVYVRPDKFNELKELWEKLNHRYLIFFNNELNQKIEQAVADIFESEDFFSSVIVTSKREKVVRNENEDKVSVVSESGKSYVASRHIPYGIFLKKLSRLTCIPVTTLHSALCQFSKRNPQININEYCTEQTITKFHNKFAEWKNNELREQFSYRRSNAPVSKTALTDSEGNPVEHIAMGRVGIKLEPGEACSKYLYDTIAYDSDLEKENILADIEGVTVYGKIPRRSIAIPSITGGTYSPDFMYVVKRKGNDKPELNVVIETKDVENESALRKEEIVKIECANVFFKSLKEDGFDVRFRAQLRHEEMRGILQSFLKNDQ